MLLTIASVVAVDVPRKVDGGYVPLSYLSRSLDTDANLLILPYVCHSDAPAEDTLNIALREITVTARDGRVSQLEQVYIRGSMIRFIIVPDLLAQAPMYVSSSQFRS